MRPALVYLLSCVVILAFSSSFASVLPAATNPSESTDPSTGEVAPLGSDRSVIQQTRDDVLSILSEPNSCSAWFATAEPQAAEKFASLLFSLDSSGESQIFQTVAWGGGSNFYQPYVARTRQNVGWGSTITFNSNGAFFKKTAAVRVEARPGVIGGLKPPRALIVGPFVGATREARLLTVLHEFGHVINLLPLDFGVPSGPEISVRNTEKVLSHCGKQIRAAKKRIFTRENTLSAAVQLSDPRLAQIAEPPGRISLLIH